MIGGWVANFFPSCPMHKTPMQKMDFAPKICSIEMAMVLSIILLLALKSKFQVHTSFYSQLTPIRMPNAECPSITYCMNKPKTRQIYNSPTFPYANVLCYPHIYYVFTRLKSE